ncbi:MAG TPA: CpsB/CapC family capsule biosynthesis tyrosine phosphatase [Planctomycetaceae bacterium]|jgi:protein-tyrosine phosphatase|nr:CpsB/CapC family capsule biosynthesis tyrosine phosphatase [Planctomycetaceae bacterium]
MSIQPEPFVDIHCHLVPGIDDGSQNWEDTRAMAEMAARDGIRTIVVTPHQLGNFGCNTGDIIRARTAELQEFLKAQKIPLRVLPGGDVRIEPGMVRKIQEGSVMSLGDHRKHVLLELPHEMYVPLDKLLQELAAARMVGILSHPERNEGILRTPQVLAPLVDKGCLMQVTAGSLMGAFGPNLVKFTEDLILQGLVHFVSTDAHSPKSRRPLLRRAFDRVAELTDVATATDLCCRNPACVAEGRDVKGGRRAAAKPARTGLFGWRKAS